MSLWGNRDTEEPAHTAALKRCAQNIIRVHREMLVSAERQIEQLGNAMLRVADTMETQKAGHLIFSVRRPKMRRMMWWQKTMEEKTELEQEFIGMVSGELKWVVTFAVEAEPTPDAGKELCYVCTKREKRWSDEKKDFVWVVIEPVTHPNLPPRSHVATHHINHLLTVARRCIGAINTRSQEGLLYSPYPTLSLERPADLQDQIVTGRVLSKRIVAELREGVRMSRERRI